MAEEQEETNPEEETASQDAENLQEDGATVPPGEEASDAAAPGPGDSEPEDELENLRQEVNNLQQKLAESADNLLRLQAEMENLRKRTSRDIENAHKYALDRFVRELLPVIDSMELGINASNSAEDIASLREGMDLTMKMFLDTLEKSGVTPIDPQGDRFDPEKHEAVSMQDGTDAEPGTVMSVMQKGYELNGRLVRPAMVIVAK